MSADYFPPVIYDLTRLVTRSVNLSPNGIDRVDFILARHFLIKGAIPLVCTFMGPRIADREKALQVIDTIESYWREDITVDQDEVFHNVVSHLCGIRKPHRPYRFKRNFNPDSAAMNIQLIKEWGLMLGHPVDDVPHKAIYLNATQFLLDRAWYVRWLDKRPDINLVTFVHDLLPIDKPQYFRPVETRLHPIRLRNACRYGAGFVVGSKVVEIRLKDYINENGYKQIPICLARLPVSEIFHKTVKVPKILENICYFMICGTIEPRKNHKLLFSVWQELSQYQNIPKLIVVGKRGWLNKDIIAQLSQSPLLGDHVFEVAGLSTPGLRNLMAGACALLMPSFGEGFGLPVAEALASCTPMIVSDLPSFREIASDAPDYLDPLDSCGWVKAIMDYSEANSPRRNEALIRLAAVNSKKEDSSFVEIIEKFVNDIYAFSSNKN